MLIIAAALGMGSGGVCSQLFNLQNYKKKMKSAPFRKILLKKMKKENGKENGDTTFVGDSLT